MRRTDEEQALEEGATALPPPLPPVCPRCGAERERRPTGTGHYILLEPEALPVALVPVGHRWYVTSDGCAVNWTGEALAALCRIAHRRVCDDLPSG
ncbi:DUF6083 domain-containing protein [Streptomyces cinnamoneus]|uniref:DUF6083 domain-containing protein n=1 Tax=Streptomyces cinnamoneus TaxID=53446 RepID=UPI00341D2792